MQSLKLRNASEAHTHSYLNNRIQEAQLSQRDRAMLFVIEYFAVTQGQGHSNGHFWEGRKSLLVVYCIVNQSGQVKATVLWSCYKGNCRTASTDCTRRKYGRNTWTESNGGRRHWNGQLLSPTLGRGRSTRERDCNYHIIIVYVCMSHCLWDS